MVVVAPVTHYPMDNQPNVIPSLLGVDAVLPEDGAAYPLITATAKDVLTTPKMEEVEAEKEELHLLQHPSPLSPHISPAQCLTLPLARLEQFVDRAPQNLFPLRLRDLEVQHLVHDPTKTWKP